MGPRIIFDPNNFYKIKSNKFLDALEDASTEDYSADKVETGTLPKNYSCNCCKASFKTNADFNLHMKNEHKNDSIEVTHQLQTQTSLV